MGDSAGGGLAFAAVHKLRDEGFALPGAVVALSPWTDLALTGPSLQSNADGLPPALIQVGSDEILRDDAVRMAEKLKIAGCDIEIEVWPRMPHVWQLYARIVPEGRDAIEHIGYVPASQTLAR